MDEKQIWQKIHDSYSKQDWVTKPSLFAEAVVQHFPTKGRLLEIGGGLGQDSKYFGQKGYEVVFSDISEEAVAKANDSFDKEISIQTRTLDVSKPLPFEDESFDIVYSHLSIHYFDKATTQKIFDEVNRVLKKGGIFAALLNSTTDPEYGTGKEIEENYFNINNLPKRFFDIKSLDKFTLEFESLIKDDKGESYKDRNKGVSGLIRYVGRKK